MELAAAGDNMKELREIAKAHIAKCKEGDLQAIKELADRLDGKPTQMFERSDGEGRPLRKVVTEIVHVTQTREEIENEEQLESKDLVVDYHEIKSVNGDGRANGNGQ
jgi:hypothetical protein